MPEADAPTPPDKTRRAVIFATVGIVVILGLAVFVVAVVAPLWQVHATLNDWSEDRISHDEIIKRLGGPKRGARQLATYLRLPSWMGTSRASAAEALGRIGPAAKVAVPVLIKALGDPDADVRWSAALALGMIGPEAKAAVPGLIKALGDPEAVVRQSAAGSLGDIGPEAKAAVLGLVKVLGDSNAYVRWYAAWALGEIGPEAKAAVPALEKLSADADPDVREAATDILKKIREEK